MTLTMDTKKFCAIFVLLMISYGPCPAAPAPLQKKSSNQIADGQTGAKAKAPSKRRPILTTQELASRVRKSLVMIVTQDHDGSAVAQGSGFFISTTLVATSCLQPEKGYLRAFLIQCQRHVATK
jgi:hypothetical protein